MDDILEGQAEGYFEDQAEDQLEDQFEDQAEDQLEDQLEDQIDQFEHQLHGQFDGQLNDQSFDSCVDLESNPVQSLRSRRSIIADQLTPAMKMAKVCTLKLTFLSLLTVQLKILLWIETHLASNLRPPQVQRLDQAQDQQPLDHITPRQHRL